MLVEEAGSLQELADSARMRLARKWKVPCLLEVSYGSDAHSMIGVDMNEKESDWSMIPEGRKSVVRALLPSMMEL